MDHIPRRSTGWNTDDEVLPDPEWPNYPLSDDFHWLRPISSCFILEINTPLRFRYLGQQAVHGECYWSGKTIKVTPDKRTYWWRPPKTQHKIMVDQQVIGDLCHNNDRTHGSFNVSLPCGQYGIRAYGTRTAVFPTESEVPLIITRSAWRDSEREKRHWAYVFCENPPLLAMDAILCWLCIKLHFLYEGSDASL